MNRAHRSTLWVAALMLLSLALAAPPAHAQATITVNSTAQEVTTANPTGIVNGNCTLGEAILAANTNAAVDACPAGQSGGTDTIMIPAGTYTLTDIAKNSPIFNTPIGLPDITEAVILQGASATMTIIERSSAGATPAFGMTAAFGGSVVFESLTIRNFFTTCGQGGAAVMRFTVPVTLNDSIVEDNFADANCGGGQGGAFAEMFNSNAPFTATNTLFRNNGSNHAAGTVVFASGPVTFTNCSFLNNHNDTSNAGGVLHMGGDGPLNITDSVFVGNNASGGGVMVLTGLPNCGPACGLNPVVNITRSVFLNNSTDCCGSSGHIGGVLESGGQTVTLTITGSTFANNTADQRGGVVSIDGAGTITIANSTFVGNSAGGGGAIFARGATLNLNLNNVTMIDNTGNTGAFLLEAAPATIRNTIVAHTINASACNMVTQFNQPLFTSQGHNVFGHIDCGGFAALDPTDQAGTQSAPLHPLVQALADNGSTAMAGANLPGVTSPQVIQTRALLTGSPALNLGDPGTPGSGSPTCEATDQRGIARPQPVGGVCDVGAFEDLTGMGVPATFDLTLSKTDSPDPVLVNNNLTWTITVTNNGPDPAPAVSLSDSLPAGVNFVSATPSNAPAGTCMEVAGLVTCSLGTLGSTASVTVTLVVTVTGAAASPLLNTATVSATGNETTPADNTAMSSTIVTGLNADLAVTNSDSPDPAILGAGNVTYTVTITNNGPNTANNVVLTNTLPASATLVSGTASQGAPCTSMGSPVVVTCNLGALANGAIATATIVVTPTATGVITNTASATATETDPNTADNTNIAQSTTVNALADLDANKSDAADPVTVGSNITYTLNVQNLGPSPATNVVLVDTLPASVTFVSVSAPCTHAAGIVTCNFGNLAAGAFTPNITLVVTTTAASVPSTFNTSTATAGEPDPDPSNNNGDETTTVNPAADLSVTKTDSPDPVTAGANLTYTITVNNAGPSAAASVTLTDTLPAGTTFVSLSSPAGWTCTTPAVGATGTINCSIASLASGVAAQTFTLVVATTTAGNLNNTATVASTTTDPTPANNSAAATTVVNAAAGTDFSIAASPMILDVAPGGTARFTLTLTPVGGSFANAITLNAAAELVNNIAFSQNPVTPGPMAANVFMDVTAPRRGITAPPFDPRPVPPAVWMLAALALLAATLRIARHPRPLRYAGGLALVLLMVAAMVSQSGCLKRQRFSGPVTVTITATSGNLSHSTTVTLNVTP